MLLTPPPGEELITRDFFQNTSFIIETLSAGLPNTSTNDFTGLIYSNGTCFSFSSSRPFESCNLATSGSEFLLFSSVLGREQRSEQIFVRSQHAGIQLDMGKMWRKHVEICDTCRKFRMSHLMCPCFDSYICFWLLSSLPAPLGLMTFFKFLCFCCCFI